MVTGVIADVVTVAVGAVATVRTADVSMITVLSALLLHYGYGDSCNPYFLLYTFF